MAIAQPQQQLTTITGLTEAEAGARRARGEGNNVRVETSRSYGDIVRANIFTFINLVFLVIGSLLVAIGRVTDAITSMGLIFFNIAIGVYQEVRAKRQLDKIALLTRPKANVIRDGVEKIIDPSELVKGDVIVVRAGDQILVDGVTLSGKMDVDESLLTGEPDLIPKAAGDQVMSGSFAVSGSAQYEAQKVGAESFANQLNARARTFKLQLTPLQRDINFVLRLLMLLALFLGFLLFVSAILYATPVMRSVQAAAVIAGLVPNGLFLMVIVAYAMAALRISGRGVLVQQTNSIESLSNVTVLCMDKTGTLTANKINYHDVYPIGDVSPNDLKRQLGDFAASLTDRNKTAEAIAQGLPGDKYPIMDEVPFSSALKWSALSVNGDGRRGVYALGALEMLRPYLTLDESAIAHQSSEWTDLGLRVLIFAHHPEPVSLHDATGKIILPASMTPLGLIAFSDELRPNVQETLKGFVAAGIQLKVISGDNPNTVASLARQAGLSSDVQAVSGVDLDAMNDAEFAETAENATIFGRITPQQKERLVEALRWKGHYVAMIGDGVNDVLSLKKANLGIAMNSGSAATRGVADLILVEDSFAALPPTFTEGQRIINGMQDVLRLFFTRALVVALLILSLAVVGVGFPFVPTHVSLLTLLTVGIPTLALAAWSRPSVPKLSLLRSVVNFVFPAAITVFMVGMLIFTFYFTGILNRTLQLDVTPDEIRSFESYNKLDYQLQGVSEYAQELAGVTARTALTTFTVFAGLILVIFVEPPIAFFAGGDELSPDKRPTYLAFGLFLVFVVIMLIPPMRGFFELVLLRAQDYAIIGGATLIWMLVLRFIWKYRVFQRFLGLESEPNAAALSTSQH